MHLMRAKNNNCRLEQIEMTAAFCEGLCCGQALLDRWIGGSAATSTQRSGLIERAAGSGCGV